MVHGIEATIARGMCVGCGACSVATGGAVKVTLSRHRLYQADVSAATPAQVAVASRVCPFSDDALNEDELSAPHPEPTAKHDHRTGAFTSVHAGRVLDDDYVKGSSSGGLTSWMIAQLFVRDEIDAVVHVGREDGEELFGYRISTSLAELQGHRKSQYYATTLKDVLHNVQGTNLRYAIVGVPCFIKAARLVARELPEIDRALVYYVGLVCGHLKSQFFAEALGWQVGVPPEELESVDFRVKNPRRIASQYDFSATSKSGETKEEPTYTLLGGSWGHGAFQPEACNFCDDIFAETADIVFGDAWLPEYNADWRGTNVVVSRNSRLDEILNEGRDDHSILLETLSVDAAAQSQSGNFRHRRDGLAVRLADDIAQGKSVPQKRVEPGYSTVTRRRRRLIHQRRRMSRASLEWFERARRAGSLAVFVRPFQRETVRYDRIATPWYRRVARRAKRVVAAIVSSRRGIQNR